MEDQESTQKTSPVVASLDRVDGQRRFVVQNVGDSSVYDVRFSIDAEREKNSPVSARDIEQVFPVRELEPGDAVSVSAIITPGTGLRFRGVVSWKDPRGSEHEDVFYMSA